MELDELVDEVERRAASAEPLSRLVAAVQLHTERTAQSDDLLDHFIQEARAAGCSWTQIGDTLGVSKQAAQKRHGPSGLRGLFRNLRSRSHMYQRFTPRARNAVVEAQQAARELGHNTIGTEHVLLGFFADDQSIASRVLAGHGIARDDVVAAIREWHDDEGEPEVVKGHIPFSDGAKQALEMALREAIDLGHNYIGTEHQLLGLLRVDDDLGAQILHAHGLTLETTRAEVVAMLGQTPKA